METKKMEIYTEEENLRVIKAGDVYDGEKTDCQKKYDVNVRYNAFTSKKENVVPEIEFNGTTLKHEIEEQNGTIYKFFMASIEAVE